MITLSTATTTANAVVCDLQQQQQQQIETSDINKKESARAHLFLCVHLHFSQTLFERAEVSYFLRGFVKIIVVAYSVAVHSSATEPLMQ